MAVPGTTRGGRRDGGEDTSKKPGREDSISELVAARLLGFLSQILGGWIGTNPRLKESLERVGGGNVVGMLEKARTAVWFAFGGDEADREAWGGFFTGLIDAVKDAKDPAEANAKMDAFFAGPVAKALLDKKDMLGKPPLMSFADALAAMSEGDDKKAIKALIRGLSDTDLTSVMARQATPALLHGLAQISEANAAISPAKLLLTLPEAPEKGAKKAASEIKIALDAVKGILDLLKSEEDPNDPAVQAARKEHAQRLLVAQRQAAGMRRLSASLNKEGPSRLGWRIFFTGLALLAFGLFAWVLGALRP